MLNYLRKDDNLEGNLGFIAYFFILISYGILKNLKVERMMTFSNYTYKKYVEINDYLVSRHRQTLPHTNSILFVLLCY